jgi:hypothetical protein
MGKYDSGHERVPQEFYPTPDWVIEALAEYVVLDGRQVWEPACGDGRMAEALKRAGATVYASDIADRDYGGIHELLDFTSLRNPKLQWLDPRIITNPPYAYPGQKAHRLAERFIEAGLHHIDRRGRGLLALLLPFGFDSIPSRRHLFADCPDFTAKITLIERIVWFERADGKTEDPKEHHAWFIWTRPRQKDVPELLYAPNEGAA